MTPGGTTSSTGGPGASALGPPAAELRGVTKRFGSVVACDSVDLVLTRGRIHGVLGENGAGKSTLMKMLIGLALPDAGTISIDGEVCRIHDPIEAARRGIGMVHQHFSLVDELTVWENVALGDRGRLVPDAVRADIGETAEHYGLAIDVDARVGTLPAGLRQRVEIIKCLRRDPTILILDEPTSVLTPEESEQLFESLRRVVDEERRAVALVSHRLEEILHATDAVTIMRRGRVVDELLTSETDAATMARAMVGREVILRSRAALGLGDDEVDEVLPVGGGDAGRVVLSLDEIVVAQRGAPNRLDRLSLDVRAGEIVGVAGVEGNGQQELGDLLSSLIVPTSGTIEVAGARIDPRRAGAMGRAGVGIIPADRHDSGVVLDMTVAENLVLTEPSAVSERGVISAAALDERARALIDEFEIQCAGPSALLSSLSGGNQQRVVLARELSARPLVLVAAQPTRGLDVGAIEYMTARLRGVAGEGVGVLLISTELDEVLDLADRIIVISGGRVIGEMDRRDVDRERLGLLLGGTAA